MDNNLRNLIYSYQRREISRDDFVRVLSDEMKQNPKELDNIFLNIMQHENASDLEDALDIIWALNKSSDQIDILNQLLLEPWHTRYEDIIHAIQKVKNPKSVLFIKEAMQKKYTYLTSYETGVRQFVNQCGHALVSIGTIEAMNVIKELTTSNDPIIRDEMLYRLSKIEGRNDYQRNYDIE